MLKCTLTHRVQVARYKFRNPWYYPKVPKGKRYNLGPNRLRNIKLSNKFRGHYCDSRHDLTDRENIQEAEDMRHPSELDFYQDHTYHSQWEKRDLNKRQLSELKKNYVWMTPGYQISPWVWYPGDLVEVVTGIHRGQRGRIRNVLAYKNQIIVEGVNVQEEEIPAQEDRPKQILHNPWPIDVTCVKHVDEKTNSLCSLRLIKIKQEDGSLVEARVSTDSGWILPIPAKKLRHLPEGDPVLDTPVLTAVEDTYDESELDELVQKKLAALESHFVTELKKAYEFYEPLQDELALDHRKYQRDVWEQAKKILLNKIQAYNSKLDEANSSHHQETIVSLSHEERTSTDTARNDART